ncbi:MAG: AraC family transcriptional regulator, partial [Cyanobacteria bacterium J06636_16]
VLGLALESQRGYHAFASDRVMPYHAPANTFAFTPATCETFSESERGGAYLIFALSPELFSTYVDDIAVHCSLTLRRLAYGRNRHVTALGRAARQFIQTHPSGSRLYFESLAGQFATHVILSLLSQPEVKKPAYPLDSRAMRQLTDFVDANLCEDLSLEVLASFVGLSASRFGRSFKATTGQTPHAWVVDRRVARAKLLLADARWSIAAIAIECGFSSQSHMTTTFAKRLGITPQQYRKQV